MVRIQLDDRQWAKVASILEADRERGVPATYCSGKRDGLDAGPAESVARALKVVQAPRKWSISLHLFFRAFHPDADRR